MNQIALLHYSVPPAIGNVETILYHHIRLLNEAGYQVRVIGGEGDNSYYEAAFYHQVDFYALPEINPAHPRTRAALRFLELRQPDPLIEEVRAQIFNGLQTLLAGTDVCIVHNAMTSPRNLLFTAALRQMVAARGRRWIAWSHGDDELASAAPDEPPWSLLYEAWPGVKYVTASEHWRDRLAARLKLPAEAVTVIPPGIEAESLFKLEPATIKLVSTLDLLSAHPLFLLQAPLLPGLNIEFAIRTVAALRRHLPAATLLIVGEPAGSPEGQDYLKSLYALRDQAQAARYIHFLFEQQMKGSLPDSLPEAILSDLYSLSDTLFYPSLNDGIGLPLLAAGLTRLPIFAAIWPPTEEKTAGLAHFLDPSSDPQAAADEIARRLAENGAYQLRRRVLADFTWPDILKHHLLPLIQQILV